MGLEQNNEQHYREVVDKYINPNADVQMTTRDYVVRPSADEVSGAITITLPPVAEAKGRFYSILCRNADAVNTITITDNNDSECWPNDIVMNGKCDRLFLYSDGLAWFPGHEGGFPQAATTYPPGTTGAPTSTGTPTTEPGSQTTTAPTTLAGTTVAPTTLAGTTLAPTTVI
jgi:hypothetical protein